VWDWAVWGALILGALAIGGGIAFLVVRALQGWRDFKRARRHLFKALDDLAAKGEQTADKAASLGDTAELEESVGRLRRSLAQLAVLREAMDEAQETVGRFAFVMPRK
jgi:3-deoxy-D-manno-octulosonic-acid transferase